MLRIGEDNIVKFKLVLTGTSQEPVARVLLKTNPAIIFDATNIKDDQWEVNMKLPETFTPGSYSFSVEVLVNGRLFVPLSDKLDVQRFEAKISQVELPKAKISVNQKPESVIEIEPKIEQKIIQPAKILTEKSKFKLSNLIPESEKNQENKKEVDLIAPLFTVDSLKSLVKEDHSKNIPEIPKMPSLKIKSKPATIEDMVSDLRKLVKT